MGTSKLSTTTIAAVIGGIIVAVILVFGTFWMEQSAQRDTDEAVHMVSSLYLDELAGRREQVVTDNLQRHIKEIRTAVDLMDEADLSDIEHLQAYQMRMKGLFNLEKFAFVDTEGTIYTSNGTQNNIDDYPFDYQVLTEPKVAILNPRSVDKKVVIAVPVNISFMDTTLCVCFMEIDMEEMLAGVSLQSDSSESTFCNIYTNEGVALTDTVLGGLAMEDNLLDALRDADFEEPYTYEGFIEAFTGNTRGQISFTYDGTQETLSFVPIEGTDCLLTYLIRESVITDQIGTVTEGIINRSMMQLVLTLIAMAAIFGFIIFQMRKNARLLLEHETVEAANRAKQEELEQRLSLQEQLLEQEREKAQQEKLITALASDYRNVFQVNLDEDDAMCYRDDPENPGIHPEGAHFPFHEGFAEYAQNHVAESYREGFMQFIDADNIRAALASQNVIAYHYLAYRDEQEYYEMLRIAGVRHAAERTDQKVHELGVGFTNIDAEMRDEMAKNQALSDALETAEQANRAKTAFLSSVSHEIRTPMNAIIGLDNIALNDPDTPEQTREYLLKIGSSAEHLLNLINDILDMSRIESGRMTLKNEEFPFAKLLEAVNTMFSGQCHEKGLDYQCHVNGQVDDYYIGDNMKLRQVLINILGNAVKFTPAGGRVSLDVERTARYGGHSTLCFKISDTGIGMSEEYLPHIFDAFSQEDSTSTNKYGSSGLGLAITKNIVEMMNGHIEVESEKGSGTTFTVTVTLADANHIGSDAENSFVRPEEMSVLVVDDDPIACKHARLVLEKAGIASESASSGAEAIEMVKLRHARRTPYNLILVDWQMPNMDGVETTRRIRAITGDESAIIILTAYRWDDILDEALTAGVDSFISKPLFVTTVLEEFQSASQRKGLSSHVRAPKADLTGRRILLAEDMPVNAEIMTMVLQMRDMKTDLAENGRIAVEKFTSHEAGYYAAILMDMRMPEMDGLEATRTIRAMDRQDAKEIPIIALTANAFDEDVQRSLQAGLNAHLSKPVQPEALFETLESLVKD